MENYQAFISFVIPKTFKHVRLFDFILRIMKVRAIITTPMKQTPKSNEKTPNSTIIMDAIIDR